MPWLRVTLPSEEVTAGRADKLQNDFEQVLVKSGTPHSAAMFATRDDKDHSFYFSPEAARIFGPWLSAHGAEECPRPDGGEVSLLIGDDSAARLLH